MSIQKRHITRRVATQGIAWTVPAVIAAGTVPAFAASTCPLKTFVVNLADLTTSGVKTATSTDGLSTYQFTYTAAVSGSTIPQTGNLTISGGKLWLMQKGATNQVAGSTTGQTLNFSFPTAVSNVTIGLADLTNTAVDAYQDQVTMYSSASNTGWTGYSGMLQDGTSTTWYRDNTIGSASYVLTNTNSLTSFGLLFNNRKSGSDTFSVAKYQDMSITNVSFSAPAC